VNVLKLKIPTNKFFEHRKWIRNLRLLNALRPKLLRSEYIKRLVDKGYELKKVKVVYNVIHQYMSLDEFSMYPEDNINAYLREKSDLSLLIERIYLKLRIVRNEKVNKTLRSNLTNHITVLSILDMMHNT
jgi:hypothetical protein